MGRTTARDTARLIEEVARGDRLLEDIQDVRLRRTVRLALGLHKDPFAAPDARARARIRFRVLGALRPHSATVGDRVAVLFELLAKPAPFLMRGVATALALAAVSAGMLVASAGAVAADPLYTVKVASERARLALAMTAVDRAAVELSIAEHRLAEATQLATSGSDDDALVATSEYGEHLAFAAAELAEVESAQPTLVAQLQEKIDTHRAVAAATAARLVDVPLRAPSVEMLTVLAEPVRPSADLTAAAAIANHAAAAADQAATMAERYAGWAGTGATVASARGERAAQIARKAAEIAKAAALKARLGSDLSIRGR